MDEFTPRVDFFNMRHTIRAMLAVAGAMTVLLLSVLLLTLSIQRTLLIIYCMGCYLPLPPPYAILINLVLVLLLLGRDVISGGAAYGPAWTTENDNNGR